MKYNGFTNAGSMYQAKCKANELPIKFVKVKIGNGLLEETEDPAKFIDVKSLKKEVGISEKTQIQDAVRLTIQMDNDGVTEGYFPREFGIYVEDEGVEVLYWYVNDGNEASYLPTQSTAPVKLKNHFNIIATSLESLVVNWSGKEFWIDKEYLEKELEKKQDMTDSRLLTTAKTIWESINELFTKKANKDDVENNLITVDEGKILDARQGPAIVNKINGLAGGYSGTFPLTTAVKEGIYLLPATNKFYVCVENYSGSSLTAPNANFEELSVFQNRNKLENLFKKQWKFLIEGVNIKTFSLPSDWEEIAFYQAEGKILAGSNNYQIVTVSYPRTFIEKYKIISTWQTAGNAFSDFEAVSYDYSDNTFTLKKVFTGGGSTSDNTYAIFYR